MAGPLGTGGFEPRTNPAERRDFFDLRRLVRDRMRWLGTWNSRLSYDTGDVVSDDGWTMVCADENGCTERPSPQPIGDPFYLYDGTDPTVSASFKSVTFGNRYTFPVGGYTTGWRVFTVAGNTYQTYLVKDPLGVAEVSELLSFTGTGGWQEFSLSPVIVEAGATFDLLAIVQEPDATPTTITGDWNYVTPQNPAAPAVGQIVHANSSLAVLSVSKTDQTGAVDLSGIAGGDIIRGPNVSWAVQSVTDQGTWIDFGVSPATQDSPDGVYEFTFETVTATPITYLEDGNYWATSPYAGSVVGLSNVNGNPPIDQGNTAYGTDLQVQSATISDEWEVVSAAGAASGGSGGSSVETPQIAVAMVEVSVPRITHTTPTTGWAASPDAASGDPNGWVTTAGITPPAGWYWLSASFMEISTENAGRVVMYVGSAGENRVFDVATGLPPGTDNFVLAGSGTNLVYANGSTAYGGVTLWMKCNVNDSPLDFRITVRLAKV